MRPDHTVARFGVTIGLDSLAIMDVERHQPPRGNEDGSVGVVFSVEHHLATMLDVYACAMASPAGEKRR